jgi:hypothetical protein
MEKRNSKSISEEILKILPSMEKEEVKQKSEDLSSFLSVTRFRYNPVFFGRNIEESLIMLFSEKQAKYQELSRKDLEVSAATFRRRPVVLGLLYATVLSRPADAGEVHVATTNSGEFRIGSLLVVRVLAFFAFAVEAEDILIESAHYPAAIKRPAASCTFRCRQKSVWHFSVLLRFGFGFRGYSVSPVLVY